VRSPNPLESMTSTRCLQCEQLLLVLGMEDVAGQL